VRKRTEKIFKRSIISLGQRAGGLQQSIADIYCKAIASCYDPHTEYFPLAEKENFESALGNDAYDFGFNTDDDDDENAGGVVISNLKPGSPAYKSGLLNKGDKLMSVQWEGKDSVDISDADNDEVSDILSSNNHDKITFTVKKSDGSTQKVTLKK
jgi:carboxyl-terminal processing protease